MWTERPVVEANGETEGRSDQLAQGSGKNSSRERYVEETAVSDQWERG